MDALLGIVFGVLAFSAWVSARKTRSRIDELEQIVDRLGDEIRSLRKLLQQTRQTAGEPTAAVAAPAPAPPPQPEPGRAADVPKPMPAGPTPAPLATPRTPPPPVPAAREAAERTPAPPVTPAAAPLPREGAARTPPVPTEPRRTTPPPSAPARPPVAAFDWESLIGVKLFSGIAGVALVLAAVFFLRYSIEHGWLQPPVRVAIGLAVAVALLVTCELKAARRYPVTANALDAAAIAILFMTFYAAHALWDLTPAAVTFVLLAVVTALAVLLSIRRGSMFIAVLGLLGGFATPALLSTGENRPIPLFAYLLLLNVGLAWVAYRRTWPVLTWLTLVLTTLYQWGWVLRFLHASSLSLAMGVFLIFPIAAVTGLLLARPRRPGAPSPADRSFERTAVLSASLPLLFAVYLAAVPAYGPEAALLFGFLLLLDAGLFVIALVRPQGLLHAASALVTLLVLAVWLATSYAAPARFSALAFSAAFVLFYLVAPAIAQRFRRPLAHPAVLTRYAAPLLLFVFPVLGRIEPAFDRPAALFGILLALLLLIAWRAIVTRDGPLYFIASFFAVAAQASWSATHLTDATLGFGVLVYTAFAVAAIATPIVARRQGAALEPAWGSGAVLLVSLGLLLFLSWGPVAPAGLWALALLLAVMNAALFVESASGGLPLVSQIGSLVSWLILATWWVRAAGTVGVLPSLTVLTGLALLELGGHAWTQRWAGQRGADHRGTEQARPLPAAVPITSSQGVYLSLVAYLFFVFLALNREWSIPPWPLFGALVVVTLATSAAALATRAASLHAAGTIAAAFVVLVWAGAAGAPPWGLVAVAAEGAVSLYALAAIRAGRSDEEAARASVAAGVCLFLGDLAVIAAQAGGAQPGFPAAAIAEGANIIAILSLAWKRRWPHVAPVAVAPAWLGLLEWYTAAGPDSTWKELLALSAALYAIFIAFPLVLGARGRADRDPYLAAVLASAMFFFSARNAFNAGGLGWAIGAVPVMAGGILALLLRELLRLEPAGNRDTGRLALVAGAALAFVTVAIPLQLRHQWITIGWALEGAALAWLYRRIPHRGLLYFGSALLAAACARLAMNPDIFFYEPRGAMRILNWYLYTYVICAFALLAAGRWLCTTEDRVAGAVRVSDVVRPAAVVLLFLLLNIEIADFYATGPTITFRFGAAVSQDLTYTIGWLAFGLILLGAGISIRSRAARMSAVSLIAVTTVKCFLYDLGSLEGLYKVASLTGLALSLVIVALVLQRFVLAKSEGTA